MKNLFFGIACLLCFIGSATVQAQEAEITYVRIPLERKAGAGPFAQSYGRLGTIVKDSTARFYGLRQTAGHLPEGYEDFVIGTLDTDFPQMAYSAIKRGDLDSADYYFGWFGDDTPEELAKMTPDFVDTEVALAYGKVNGKRTLIIDTDNDERFDDEAPYQFTAEDSTAAFKGRNRIFKASVERMVNGLPETDTVHFVLTTYFGSGVLVNPSEHSVGQVNLDGEEKFIYLSNSFYGIRHASSYMNLLVSDSIKGDYSYKNSSREEVLKYDDVFETAAYRYVISGVNDKGTELVLKRISKSGKWVGTQVGATAPDFEAEALTGETISLNSGKYKLLDFWGTWCAPCREEVPYLLDAYEFFAGDNFELIAIANDSEKRVKDYIENRKLDWPQLIQRDGDPVIEAYQVSGYPSTFLLSPENEVLIRNRDLRGRGLVTNLSKVLEVSDEQLKERIKAGNVLLKVNTPGVYNVKLYGEFTNKVPKPLYEVKGERGTWQRGLQLEAGTYEVILRYQNSGSWDILSKEAELVVTGEAGQVIELKFD